MGASFLKTPLSHTKKRKQIRFSWTLNDWLMKLSDTSKMNSRVADMGHITQCFVPYFLKTLSCLYTYSNSIRRRASPTLLIFFPTEFYDTITLFHFIFLFSLSLGLGKEWQIGGEFEKSYLCLFWHCFLFL